jgi:hypothetical protein
MASSKKATYKGSKKEVLSFTAHTFLADFTVAEQKHAFYDILDDMGKMYGRIKRSLFKDCIRSGLKAAHFKNGYLLKYGITARQFNAIRYDLDGNISSAVEVLKLRITSLEDKIKSVKKWLKSKEAKIRGIHKDVYMSASERDRQKHNIRFAIHHKKRKLHALELKLVSLQNDLK